MATETDAARDRVLAARAALGEELETLEASARAAVDVPGQDPAQPGQGRGRRGRRRVPRARRAAARLPRGPSAPSSGAPSRLPESMLPEEIEKALRELGDDGDKVRGALERDFAAYAAAGATGSRPAADAAVADRRPAAPVGGDQGGRRAGCSAPTTRASRRGWPRSARASAGAARRSPTGATRRARAARADD